MISNIEEMNIEYSSIKNERNKNANIKIIDIDQYISPVSPCPDSGDLNKDE